STLALPRTACTISVRIMRLRSSHIVSYLGAHDARFLNEVHSKMASYHGPKARVQRRFGEVLIPRPKYARILERRAYPPGDHGKEKQFRSGRRSDYGTQLNEKQKLSFIYNIRERQLRNYFVKARQQTGNTGANLLILLE